MLVHFEVIMFDIRKLFPLTVVFFAVVAQADDATIGYVKNASGEASISASGKSNVAQAGTPIQVGNLLKTGANGTMGITFKDNTVMSFGNNTELTVDEYLYAPTKGELKLAASMSKGALQYVSGVIAKLRPEAISVKTPLGTIGVRGTRFLVKVDEK